jgi:hypothetical protein
MLIEMKEFMEKKHELKNIKKLNKKLKEFNNE